MTSALLGSSTSLWGVELLPMFWGHEKHLYSLLLTSLSKKDVEQVVKPYSGGIHP